MKTSTAYNHQTRLSSKLRDIYRTAYFDNPEHKTLISRVTERIWSDPALKKCPSWVEVHLHTLHGELFEDVQQNRTFWGFLNFAGEIVGWDQLDEPARKSYCGTEKKGKAYWLRQKTGPGGKMSVVTGSTLTRTFEITRNEW